MNGYLSTIILLVLCLGCAIGYIAYLEQKIGKLNDKIALFQKEHDALQKCMANLKRASILYTDLGKKLGAFQGTLNRTKESINEFQNTELMKMAKKDNETNNDKSA